MELESAYVAGFFDGEGSIWISKIGNSFTLKASISQAESSILEKIKKKYGGRIDKWKSKLNNKNVSKWELSNASNVVSFLEDIYPYLHVKKIQAEFAFHFYNLPWRTFGKGGVRHKLTSDQLEIDEMLSYSIKIAKPRHWENYDIITSDEELLEFIFNKVCEKYN